MAYQIDVTRQNVIVARLADFCRWSSRVSDYDALDPWLYMRNKIQELREPILRLKQDQLMAAADAFITQLTERKLEENDIVEFKTAIHDYLSPSDFIDISFNLTPETLSNLAQREIILKMIRNMKAFSPFSEIEKAKAGKTSKAGSLVWELHDRLELAELDKTLFRMPRTSRRKRMVLRRIRRNVAEYCSVLHLSFEPNDTFSPFMLLRVEALLVACLRLLDKYSEDHRTPSI